MADILMNPGAEKCKLGTWDQAYENIKRFIEECEIPMHIVRSDFTPNDGRYSFVLDADEFSYNTIIEMPGLPLEQVRYMDEEGQNPFEFPRLYVDGGSWLWKFALITKEQVIEVLNERISDKKSEIEAIKEMLETS